jgi:signal transduction histidine kinase
MHDAFVVEVDDDGLGALSRNGDDGGTGLVGMRERVQAAGGRLEAGPRAERGFRVRAVLPTGAE